MEHVARTLNADPEPIKRANFYKQGDVTPYGQPLTYFNIPTIWDDVKKQANYEQRAAQVNAFNAANRWSKQGIAIVPVKYGLVYSANSTNSIVSIYADGSVEVSHSGIESGQSINTKVAQVVAKTLGCPYDSVSVGQPSSFKAPGTSITGGSVTSELCCSAAQHACQRLAEKLAPFRALSPGSSWPQIVATASSAGVALQEIGWRQNPILSTNPFPYVSYGAAVSRVQIDALTGELEILSMDIVFDCGISLNPFADLGQVEGCALMGIGMYTSEVVNYDATSGKLLTDGTFTYKPPGFTDIPIEFTATLLPDAPNPAGFLRSKAVGEPPLILASSVFFAIKHALYEARADADADVLSSSSSNAVAPAPFFELDAPATVDKILAHTLTSPSQFSL
jgi:xanthine dehydrogenase/oxidase